MFVVAHLSASGRAAIIVGGALLVWLILAAVVASYGRGRGYPWVPLFIAGFFLGFPLVLLAVVIGEGPRLANRSAPSGRASIGRPGSEARAMLDELKPR